MLLLHEIATLYPSNNYKKDDIDFNLFEIILNDIKNKSSMVLEIGMDSDDNIYNVVDVWWKGEFNSGDDYAQLNVGKTYRVKGYGIRFPFLSMYYKIYSM